MIDANALSRGSQLSQRLTFRIDWKGKYMALGVGTSKLLWSHD